MKTTSILDRLHKYRFVCDVAISLTAEKIARLLTAALDRVLCGQTLSLLYLEVHTYRSILMFLLSLQLNKHFSIHLQ